MIFFGILKLVKAVIKITANIVLDLHLDICRRINWLKTKRKSVLAAMIFISLKNFLKL